MIGKKLKKLREELNLTQEELGKLLGLSKATIAQYENDRRQPDLKTLKKICEFFGVSADYFLELQDTEVAFHLVKDISELSDEDREKIINLIKFLRTKSKK